MLQLKLAVVGLLLIAEFLNVAQVAEGAQEFKRCYNSSEYETHCFDVQYDSATNQPLHTSFQNAQMRCRSLNSTLVIIKNEEISNLIQQFVNDNNPIKGQYFWLNAYQVNYFNNSSRWHWLNFTLPNLPESAVSYTYDSGWCATVLEFRSESEKSQFYLTAKQPYFTNSYVCEYSESNCSSASSSIEGLRIMNGRCYRAVQGSVNWYEARNRCLQGGGDLASFANVNSINFTSWLGSDPHIRYWIGLRFIWYTWGDLGPEMKYTNWATDGLIQNSLCVIFCFNCVPAFSWSSKDCGTTDSVYVVCHTVTSLKKTTTSTTETTSSTQISNQPAATSTFPGTTLANKEARTASSINTLGIGLGVGLGVPFIIFIILTVLLAVRSKRSKTLPKQQARSESNELSRSTVQEPSIRVVNESDMDHYQHLNRNLNNTSGTTYDSLQIESGQNYEELPSNAT